MSRQFAVSVLVNLRDRLSAPLGGLQRRLSGLASFGARLGLGRLGSALGGVIGQFTLLATVATAAFAPILGGAWAITKGIANAGDEAFKASQRIGVNVEKYQELAWAAKLSDLSATGLQRALGTLNEKAAAGDEMFGKLGIQLRNTDGSLRDSGEYLLDFADLFASLPEGVERSALATSVFGDRLGRELIPFLNEGRAGLERLGQQARDLGIVLPEELAKAAVDWNDNVTTLGAVFDGLKMEVFGPLIPVFNDLTTAFREFIQANRAEIVEGMTGAINTMIDALPTVIDGIRTAGEVLGVMLSAGNSIIEMIGGFEVVAVGLAAILSGKLLVAIGSFGAALIATPIGKFIILAALLARAAKWIYDNWDGIAAWFSWLWEGVVHYAAQAFDFLKQLFSWTPLGMLIENWGPITAYMAELWESVVETASALPGQIGDVIASNAGAVFDAGVALMQSVWDGLKAKFSEVVEWVRGIPALLRDMIGNPFAAVEEKWNQLRGWLPWGGSGPEPAAPAAATNDNAIAATSEFDRVSRELDALSRASSAAGATPLRPQEQKVGGEIVVKVEGPGEVTSVRNDNRDVRITAPDRGQSLGVP